MIKNWVLTISRHWKDEDVESFRFLKDLVEIGKFQLLTSQLDKLDIIR